MTKLLGLTALLASTASFAFAQDAFTAVDDIDDQIEAVEEAVEDDFEKNVDEQRFENVNYQEGWRGAFAISGAMNSFTTSADDEDTTDSDENFSIGARITNGSGYWEQSMGIFYSYSHEDDGSTTADDDDDPNETVRASYELNRAISDRFYGFANITASRSSNDLIDYSGFTSLGLGYRLVNSENFAWRVQAGPGYSYAVDDENGLESQGGGAVVASRLFYQLTPTASITNDTEYQWSEDVQTLTNDLGLNFKVTDNLVTRLGYVTTRQDVAYDDEALSDYYTLENNFTISAVLSF